MSLLNFKQGYTFYILIGVIQPNTVILPSSSHPIITSNTTPLAGGTYILTEYYLPTTYLPPTTKIYHPCLRIWRGGDERAAGIYYFLSLFTLSSPTTTRSHDYTKNLSTFPFIRSHIFKFQFGSLSFTWSLNFFKIPRSFSLNLVLPLLLVWETGRQKASHQSRRRTSITHSIHNHTIYTRSIVTRL